MNSLHANPLSTLPHAAYQTLFSQGGFQSVQRGEVLLRAGQHSDSLRLVLSGKLKASHNGECRAVRPQETIGMTNVLNPGKTTHTVVAVQPSKLWVIRHHSLRRFLTTHPEALEVFLECLDLERHRQAVEPQTSIAQMMVS